MKTPLLPKFILTASVALICSFATVPVQAVTATALVNNAGTLQLLTFDTATPGIVGSAVTISGLGGGEALTGIDYRPLDQLLVGFGYTSATGAGKVYSINISTGVLTSINSNTLTLSTGLSRVMADFNPAANALRLTTSGASANNLRLPGGGTGVLTTDTDLNPANTGIRATAYSRNNAGGGTSGATTLYEIDGTNLINQGSVDFFAGSGTSPNTGTLTTVAALTGVTAASVVGLDIHNVTGTATTSPGSAFLSTSTGGFLSLNLTTAAASSIGTIGGTYTNIVDTAIVPEPSAIALVGLAAAGFAARRNRRKPAVA
jgi:hypothetical protein